MWLSTGRMSPPRYGCAKQGGSWREKESGEKAQEAGEERGCWHFILSPLLLSFLACSCSAALGGRQTPQQGCNTQVLGSKSDDGTHTPHLEEIHTFAQLLPSGGRQHLSSRCSLRRNRDLTGVSERRAAEYALHLGIGAFFELWALLGSGSFSHCSPNIEV